MLTNKKGSSGRISVLPEQLNQEKNMNSKYVIVFGTQLRREPYLNAIRHYKEAKLNPRIIASELIRQAESMIDKHESFMWQSSVNLALRKS